MDLGYHHHHHHHHHSQNELSQQLHPQQDPRPHPPPSSGVDEEQEDGSGSSDPIQPFKKQKIALATISTHEPPPPPIIDVPEYSDEESEELAQPQAEEACEISGNPKADNEKTKENMRLGATITDADVFDCPICFENLRIPVYQCENGHVACHSCCRKINKKCPTCSLPIKNRCRIMEKVLETVQVSCGNLMYGCKDVMKLCDKREHEEDRCVYTRCLCPMQDCDFVDSASKLYQHFVKKHIAINFTLNHCFSVPVERNTKFLFLRENTSGAIFVLNQFTLNQGIAVSVILIAPKSSSGKYHYKLEAKEGQESLSFELKVTSVTKLVDYCPTKYLVVFEDFLSPLGQVMLQIRICRAKEAKGNSAKKK